MFAFTLVSCTLFNIQLFLVPFDVDILSFTFFQTLNVAHFYCYFFLFANTIYTLNVFLLTLIWYFRKKFHYIAEQVIRLHVSNRKPANNRKLARLVFEYATVHLELNAMRDLFKQFVGYNLCYYFLLGLLVTFACLFADMRMAVGVLVTIYLLGLSTIFSFYFATCVNTQVLLKSKVLQSATCC